MRYRVLVECVTGTRWAYTAGQEVTPADADEAVVLSQLVDYGWAVPAEEG